MSTDEATPPLVGHVVGENVKRLREGYGLTQAELARRAQATGLRWSRSHVAALEAGNRESVEAGTLALLALAADCTVPELFDGEGPVRLTSEAVTTRAGIRGALAGTHHLGVELEGLAGARQTKAASTARYVGHGDQDEATGLHRWYDVTPLQVDADLAERLGIEPATVTEVAGRLYDGRSLHQERDRRLAELPPDMPAGERRASRGHLTRVLAKEVEASLDVAPPITYFRWHDELIARWHQFREHANLMGRVLAEGHPANPEDFQGDLDRNVVAMRRAEEQLRRHREIMRGEGLPPDALPPELAHVDTDPV